MVDLNNGDMLSYSLQDDLQGVRIDLQGKRMPKVRRMPKVSSHEHFIEVITDLVQDLLSIDKSDRTTFEKYALKKMLMLLGRDASEAE